MSVKVVEYLAGGRLIGVLPTIGYCLIILVLVLLALALLLFSPVVRRILLYTKGLSITPRTKINHLGIAAPSGHNKQRFVRQIIEANPDLMYVYEPTSRESIFSNRDCGPLLGFAGQTPDLLFFYKQLHKIDLPAWENSLAGIEKARDGEILHAEYRVQHKYGHYVWVNSRSRVIERNGNGVPSQVLVVLQDNTEKRRADEKLVAGQQQYFSVMESVKEVIFQTDHEGKLTFLNPAWTEITGFNREESLGMYFFEHVHPEDKDQYWMLFLPLITKQQPFCQHEVRYVTREGGFRWMEARARLTVNKEDQVTGISGTLTDVTERRTAEHKLRKSEQLYRLISENSRDLITLSDERGYSLYVSPSVKEVLGFNSEELIGSSFFDFIHPGDVADVQQEMQQVVEGGGLHRLLEYRSRRKSGEYIWLQTHIRPVTGANEKLINLQTTSRDITDRRVAEEKLRESEKLYRLISENAKDLVALHTPEGTFRYLSPSVQEILGYTPDELLGITPFTCIHPEELKQVKAAFANTTSSESHTQQYRAMHKDGHYTWLETQLRPIVDNNGQVEAVQATTRDISSRKLAEQSITRMSNLLISILDNSLTCIMAYQAVHDQGGEIIDFEWQLVNKKAGLMLGLNPEELIGQRLLEIMPHVRKSLFEPYKRVVEEGKPWEEDNYILEPGGERCFHLVAVSIGDGCAVMCTDISRQKQLQAAAILQKERMEQVYRITSNVTFNASTQVFETLKAATESLGLQLGILNRIDDQVFTVQEVYTKQEDFYKGSTLPINTTYCSIPYYENRLIAISNMKDCPYSSHSGYEVHGFESYVGVPVWIKGRKYGVLMFAAYYPLPHGISQGDCDFVQMLSQWIGSVLERSIYQSELIHAKEQAEYSAQAKEQFLSTMSHEIRTPMNAVIGMTHLLMQENPRLDQIGNLKTLQFSAENLLVLINDILDYNKIETGMVTFECIPFSLISLLESIRFSLGFKAEEKQIGFIIHSDAQLPPVLLGDPVRLAQVLTNLVSNAIKFTEKGAVTLEVVLRQDNGIRVVLDFAVTDTGIGIKADKLAYIFDRFTQAESDTTRKYGGTGLGLAITKRLLEMQGSEIMVTSQFGEGSRFFFTLTFGKGNENSLVSDNSIQREAVRLLDHVRLLLVEDNEINRKVASKFLNKWGIQPDYAYNGLQALERVKAQDYDLILMDLQMPEMDGYEASRLIRQIKAKEGIPIIALTASAMHDVAHKIFDAGMNDFVTKPFNPDELYQKIARYASPGDASEESGFFEESDVPTDQAEVLDIAGLVEIAGEGTAFLEEMIRMHIKMFTQFAEEYRLALEKKDAVQLQFIFHRVKSSCVMLRITTLEEEYAAVKELLGGLEATESLEDSVGRVKTSCARITHKLQQELARLAVK